MGWEKEIEILEELIKKFSNKKPEKTKNPKKKKEEKPKVFKQKKHQ